MGGGIHGVGGGGDVEVFPANHVALGHEIGHFLTGGVSVGLFGSEFNDGGLTDNGLGAFDDLAWHNVVLDIVLYLFFAVAVGFVDGALHGAGDDIAVEYGFAVYIAGGTANGLDKGTVAAQESLLIGIEDGYE